MKGSSRTLKVALLLQLLARAGDVFLAALL
jgi:hypothetical protein